MTNKDVVCQKNGQLALIKLNRPGSLNALREQVWIQLNEALTEVKNDREIRVLVITGEGSAFSVGADIKELGQFFAGEADFYRVRENILRMQKVTMELASMPKPVIAAVNGYALGAGAEIAIACDIRIASEKAVFGFPEVKVGLFESNGITHILPRLVGLGKAKELIMTGEEINAIEARRIGLVERVVPHENIMQEAEKMALRVAENAPVPVSLAKSCLNKGVQNNLETALTYETEALLACIFTNDVREGAMAFLERRKPRFSGR